MQIEIREVALVPHFVALSAVAQRSKWLTLLVRGARVQAHSRPADGRAPKPGAAHGGAIAPAAPREAGDAPPAALGAGATFMQESARALGASLLPLGVQLAGSPPPRTEWTRRVPHPVLIGHAWSLTPY